MNNDINIKFTHKFNLFVFISNFTVFLFSFDFILIKIIINNKDINAIKNLFGM